MRPVFITFLIALQLAGVTLAQATIESKVAANNTAALKKLVGEEVTVTGKVNRATISSSGHHFLNFYSSDLSVVCFRSDVAAFKGGGPAKLWKNKSIEVSGKLELYKGKPQIKVTSPSQIVEGSSDSSKAAAKDKDKKFSLDDIRVDGSGGPEGSKKPFELKQTGELTWLSPAGLIYRGRDPQGKTRVEHVLRHAKDQPRRRGSHGVFDGGRDQALATVDEAWKLAKQKKIKPKKEGDRLAYTIPMGKRVGYLGGSSGARRNNPPLSKVFIVVKGKSEVITAFPR